MNFTKEAFEADLERYESEVRSLRSQGYADAHPLIGRLLRRIDTVKRVLSDPALHVDPRRQEK